MIRVNWLAWVWVVSIVVTSGCASTSTSFKNDAEELSPGQATVFGRVTLLLDGRQQKLNRFGDTILRLVVRGENDAGATQYAVRDPGYFFWNLPPGRYMVIGYVILLERGPIRMDFVVPPGAKALYLGDLTISFSGDYYQIDYKDDFTAGTEAFRKKFPGSQFSPERADAGMEKKPGNFSRMTWVCGPDWGLDCKGGAAGVKPIYPEERGGKVDSLEPTLSWTPSLLPDVTYDVVVYEEQKFPRNQLGVVMDSLPGRQIYYTQGVRDPMVKLDTPLRHGASYFWSVRLRRGETVSTWSTFGYFDFYLVGWQSGRGRWFSFATPTR